MSKKKDKFLAQNALKTRDALRNNPYAATGELYLNSQSSKSVTVTLPATSSASRTVTVSRGIYEDDWRVIED